MIFFRLVYLATGNVKDICDLLLGRGVIGGYQALFRFELPACYHPKLGIFWGVLFYQKKFLKKKDPMPVKSLFENTRGNPFLTFQILTKTQ